MPSLFQDNFDYGDIRRDFVHGVLTSDLLMKSIHCYVVKEGYAARVADTRSYDSVRYGRLLVFNLPSSFIQFYTARTSSHAGHSRWYQTITTQAGIHMNTCAATRILQKTTPSSYQGKSPASVWISSLSTEKPSFYNPLYLPLNAQG